MTTNCTTFHVGPYTGPSICGFTGTVPDLGTYSYVTSTILATYDLSDTFPYITFPRNPSDPCSGVPSCHSGDGRNYPGGPLVVGGLLQDADFYAFTDIYADDAMVLPTYTPQICENAGVKWGGGTYLFSLSAGATANINVIENYGLLAAGYGIIGAVIADTDPRCQRLCCHQCHTVGGNGTLCTYSWDAKISASWTLTSPTESGSAILRYNPYYNAWVSPAYISGKGVAVYSNVSVWGANITNVYGVGTAVDCETVNYVQIAGSSRNATMTSTLISNNCCQCAGGPIYHKPGIVTATPTNPCTTTDAKCCPDPTVLPSSIYSDTYITNSSGDCAALTPRHFIAILDQVLDSGVNPLAEYLYSVSPTDSDGNLIPELIWKIHIYCNSDPTGGWTCDIYANDTLGNSCMISRATKNTNGDYTGQMPFTYPYLFAGVPTNCICSTGAQIFTNVT
jgi:hypothetical protein